MKKHSSTLFACFTLALYAITLTAFNLINKKVNIVFIGDSITQGSRIAELQPSVYALTYLKNKTGFEIGQSNQGVSGHTTLDFLPGENDFKNTVQAADAFYADSTAQLIFSVMLGTNDSAIQGTHGAPVSPEQYRGNLKTIIDSLLIRYPESKVVINHPLWYSPNTYNGSKYLAEGLARLQTYFPEIKTLYKSYRKTHPGQVFIGDTKGFNYFKANYLTALKPEQGKQGTFYLHPNQNGAARLGELWGKAIYKIITR